MPFHYERPVVTKADLRVVNSLSDLPSPDGSGVITFPSKSNWLVLGQVDLQGSRIVCDGEVSILGFGPETCTITSTGLPAGQPILFTERSLTLRGLGIVVPAGTTGVEVVSNGFETAIDWFKVNFLGTGRSASFTDADNVIAILMAWLGADGFLFDGDVGTVAITESLFAMSSGQTAVEFAAGASVNRRMRVESSTLVIPSGATGIRGTNANFMLLESCILDRANFTGGGVYVDGVTFLDDAARWRECRGIQNTSRICEFSWTGNTAVTVLPAADTPVKGALTASVSALNQRFSVDSSGTATYDSELSTIAKISASVSLEGGNNRRYNVILYKNGAPVGTPTPVTTGGTGRAENILSQQLVEVDQGDTFEVWVENAADATNVTLVSGNVLISEA